MAAAGSVALDLVAAVAPTTAHSDYFSCSSVHLPLLSQCLKLSFQPAASGKPPVVASAHTSPDTHYTSFAVASAVDDFLGHLVVVASSEPYGAVVRGIVPDFRQRIPDFVGLPDESPDQRSTEPVVVLVDSLVVVLEELLLGDSDRFHSFPFVADLVAEVVAVVVVLADARRVVVVRIGCIAPASRTAHLVPELGSSRSCLRIHQVPLDPLVVGTYTDSLRLVAVVAVLHRILLHPCIVVADHTLRRRPVVASELLVVLQHIDPVVDEDYGSRQFGSTAVVLDLLDASD